MKKLLVFSLFVANIIFETSAKCELHVKNTGQYFCIGGQISDLDEIKTDATAIDIEEMEVTKFPANILTRFNESLVSFGCSYCGIEEIEPGAFRSLDHLEQLILSNNQLTSIKTDWISGPRDLSYLDLSYNKIKHIDDEVYGHIPFLGELRLTGNPIDCINTEALSNLKELTSIHLTEMVNFKCPRTIAKFLSDRNIDLQTDQSWETVSSEEEEQFLKAKDTTTNPETQRPTRSTERTTITPVNTTPLPLHTTVKPHHSGIFESSETLAPKMTTEDIDIPEILTTNSLPKIPINYQTEINNPVNVTTRPDVLPVQPVQQPSEIINASSLVTPIVTTTISPQAVTLPDLGPPKIVITPSEPTVIYRTPEPTPPPKQGSKVLPTPGEKPLEVEALDKQMTVDKSAESNQTPSTQTSTSIGARVNAGGNKYFFGMFVAIFLCSFFVRS